MDNRSMRQVLPSAGIAAPTRAVASDRTPILEDGQEDRELLAAFTPLQEARLRQIVAEEIDRRLRREWDCVEARAGDALPHSVEPVSDTALGNLLSRLARSMTSSPAGSFAPEQELRIREIWHEEKSADGARIQAEIEEANEERAAWCRANPLPPLEAGKRRSIADLFRGPPRTVSRADDASGLSAEDGHRGACPDAP